MTDHPPAIGLEEWGDDLNAYLDWLEARTGPSGSTVPPGGTTGQVLGKASSTNFDTAWLDTAGSGGGSGGVPAGGTTGQLLAKNSNTDFDSEWIDPAVYTMSGPTVDTAEDFRVIMFSDGSMRAIPVDAVAPDPPVTFTLTPKITSVSLVWSASAGASTYRIYRDDGLVATVSALKYRDGNVVVGSTYTYNVQAVSGYGLRSILSIDRSAFIDPALNQLPTVEVRTWPADAIALGNRAIVRINATDVDGQALATILGTDIGSLVATGDPTTWYLDPA